MPSIPFNYEKYKADELARLEPSQLTKEQKKYMCDKGHELKALGLPYVGIPCTICGRPMPQNSCMYSCSECKIDKCTNCFHNLDSNRTIPRAPDCPSCENEMEWTDFSDGIYATGWFCNNFIEGHECGARKKTHGAWRWFCIECNIDFCHRCKRPLDDSWQQKETPRTIKMGQAFLEKCKNYQWDDVFDELGQNPGLVNLSFNGCWSALHYACRSGQADLVEFLLDRSADAAYVAGDGKTPIDCCRDHNVNLLMISSSYLMPARIVFSHYDVNGSGSIDLHELSYVLKTVVPKLSDEDIKVLFADCDVDGSGEIDYAEFCVWLYAGSGRRIASNILATADKLANPELDHLRPAEGSRKRSTMRRVSSQSGFLEAQKQTQEKMEIFSTRLELEKEELSNGDEFSRIEVNGKEVHPGKPPMRLMACEDHIREMAPHLEGLKFVEEMLDFVEQLAEEQVQAENELARMIDDKQMLFAIILYTFDMALIGKKKISMKKNNFRFIFSKTLRERDNDFIQVSHGYLYYLLTGLTRLPVATGVVYQGIHKENVEKALEVLKEGSTHVWPTCTSGGRLLNYMAEFQDEGIVLLIHLHPQRAQATDLSKITAISNTDEVLLWPNFRVRVKGELKQKRGFNVIECQEMFPDTALILRAEDFDE